MGQHLEELWIESQHKKDLKVRYVNWDHRTKYFEIHNYSPDKKLIVGKLDNGEEISFPLISQHWVLYEEEMEHFPKAV